MPSSQCVGDQDQSSDREEECQEDDEEEEPVKSLEDFEIIKQLGEGGFAKVFLAILKEDHTMCALKKISKNFLKKKNRMEILDREIFNHKDLRHPNILHMFDYFENCTHLFLILENAAGGDLLTLMLKQPNKRFKTPQAARYVSQIARGLHYIHSNGIMHRDIKPDNILLNIEGDVKIADFGLSVEMDFKRKKSNVGSLLYKAPEIILRQNYDHRVDIWSLGIVAFELINGFPPFFSRVGDEKETQDKITEAKIEFPDHFTNLDIGFVKKLIQLEPCLRTTLPNLQKHYWIKVNRKTDDLLRLK